MFYRVAWKRLQSVTWEWKSTKLTSRVGLHNFLSLYRAIPLERLRIFSAPSIELLEEQLELANASEQQRGHIELSLLERGFYGEAMAQEAPMVQETMARRAVTVPLTLEASEVLVSSVSALKIESISSFDQRRLELERGCGGDHDQSYTFVLPETASQVLAWSKLLGRVQRGELQRGQG